MLNRPLCSLLALALAAALGGCAATGSPATGAAGAGHFAFGVWGDMPYLKNGDDPQLKAVLDSLNAADIAFSLYDGDIKDGSSKCTDAVFTDALAMFNRLVKPVV